MSYNLSASGDKQAAIVKINTDGAAQIALGYMTQMQLDAIVTMVSALPGNLVSVSASGHNGPGNGYSSLSASADTRYDGPRTKAEAAQVAEAAKQREARELAEQEAKDKVAQEEAARVAKEAEDLKAAQEAQAIVDAEAARAAAIAEAAAEPGAAAEGAAPAPAGAEGGAP